MTPLWSVRQAKEDVLVHAFVDLFIGFGFLVCGPHRTSSASFVPLKSIWHTSWYPVRTYGLVLAVIGVLFVVSLIVGSQGLYEVSKTALLGFYGFIAGIFLASFINGDASPLTILNVVWFRRTWKLSPDNPYRKIALSH